MLKIIITNRGDNMSLRATLRSIDKFLEKPYEIVVIGDVPSWVTNVQRYVLPKVSSNPYADTVRSLSIMAELYDEFIWWHDDFILLKPTTQDEIRKVRHHGRILDVYDNETLLPAFKRIKEDINQIGIDGVKNYATHTPMLFNGDNLLDVIDRFNFMDNPRLFIETYYYNIYHGEVEVDIGDDKITNRDSESLTVVDTIKKLRSGKYRYLNTVESETISEDIIITAVMWDILIDKSRFEIP